MSPTPIRIRVPSERQTADLLSFGLTLQRVVDAPEYEFDFSGISFTSPKWMILTAGAIEEFKRNHPHSRRRAVDYQHLTYAAHMGYFQHLGMKFGSKPEEAPGSSTYVPITNIQVEQIERRATREWKHHGDVIEKRAENLARVLTQAREGRVYEALAYSIREIVRNVVEHSGAGQLTFVAQYWPTRSLAEIVVADNGIGISASLRENPALRHVDDATALTAAVQPGISSKAWRRSQSSNPWANSGYGLYMTRRLCAIGRGEFTLQSGASALVEAETEKAQVDSLMRGTTVALRLDTSSLPALDEALSRFREEGARLAKQIGGANRRGPSLSSTGLGPR